MHIEARADKMIFLENLKIKNLSLNCYHMLQKKKVNTWRKLLYFGIKLVFFSLEEKEENAISFNAILFANLRKTFFKYMKIFTKDDSVN